MNVQGQLKNIVKVIALLLGLGLGWFAYKMSKAPKLSEAFLKKATNILMLSKMHDFYSGGFPKKFVECRWSGKIVLVNLPYNYQTPEYLDVHPASSYLSPDIVASSGEGADVLGYVAESTGRGGMVSYGGGLVFVIMMDLKTSNILGVELIKEFKEVPTAAQFEAEYPNVGKKLNALHDPPK